MRFELLGPLSVRKDGGAIALGGPREQKLLATLVLRYGYPQSRSQLAAAMWAGRPPATATAQLHNSVAAVRRTLGGEVRITRTPGGFALDPTGHELDLTDFCELVAEAEALAPTEPAVAVARFRSALALWRGPALAGLTDGALAAEARRLEEEHRLPCLERCLTLELAQGHHWRVIGELAALIAAHPLRERLVELRMLALHQTGRRPEALAAYADLRGRLAVELGVEPALDLQRLHRAIQHDQPAADASRPQPSAALAAQLEALAQRVAALECRLALATPDQENGVRGRS